MSAEKQLLAWLNEAKGTEKNAENDAMTANNEPLNLPPPEHSVKVEIVDTPEDHPECIDISTATQNYILQQQQLSYGIGDNAAQSNQVRL